MVDLSDRPRIEKPPEGDACNGCGLCCIAEQCAVSVILFEPQDQCPALEIEDGRYWCGLMQNPGNYNPVPEELKDAFQSLGELAAEKGIPPEAASIEYWKLVLGAGRGCDSTDDLTLESLVL